MKWRELLYFSKGERLALSILLILIAMAWTAVIYTDIHRLNSSKNEMLAQASVHDTIRLNGFEPVKSSILMEIKSHPKEKKLSYARNMKYPKGTVVELNSADTTILKKVPGIGSSFAKRIVKYRDLLGGFYSADQLSEVYGIDEERYMALRPWFTADSSLITPLNANELTAKELSRHPYINYKQAKQIEMMVKRRGAIKSYDEIILLEEFNGVESKRIKHYLSFK